jgi:hypothetical protein
VPSSWTVGPEDEGKFTSRQDEIFTNTAVRISLPPTVVPKRRQETTNGRCVKSPPPKKKSAYLIYSAFEAQNQATVEVLRFLLSAYGSVLIKTPDDGSVEPKRVAMKVFLTINWMCLKKICTLYAISMPREWKD